MLFRQILPRMIVGLIAVLVVFLQPACAAEDVILRDSDRCSRYFSQIEQQYNIPANLLKAVSVTESGVYHKESERLVPWPWTVNSQGRSYYFKNKQAAITAVRKMMRRGISSIDVGCMQINLHYHPEAFTSLDEAFEPKYNIAYAATFLQSNYARLHNWLNAVASYHSETPQYGRPYAKKVLAVWRDEPRLQTISVAQADPSSPTSTSGFIKPLRSALHSPHLSRARSNMFIKVHQHRTPDMNTNDVVANITQNLLRKYPPKPAAVVALD